MPPTSDVTAACPVCGSTRLSTTGRVTSQDAALHFCAREDAHRFAQLCDSIETLWGRTAADLHMCGDCHFGFAWPYVAGDADYYRLAYERAQYPADKWDYDRAGQALDALPAPTRVLEIGAGFGHFLDRVRARVPGVEVVATEYGEPARDVLTAKGYDVRPLDVRSLDEGPFDLICAFQVVEHLDGLDRLGATLHRLLTPGGHVLVAVPNTERIAFDEARGSLLDMPPNHIGRWSREAFETFAADHDLDLVAFDHEPHVMRAYVRTDIAYSYARRAQVPGTVPHWSAGLRQRRFGKALGMLVALLRAPVRIPVWIEAARRDDLGSSSFAVLRRAA
ncbi:MAG: class I SAM-dependent methyltransferase [Aeromicrobium sp.]